MKHSFLVFCFLPIIVFGQLKLQSGYDEFQKQVEAGEMHEALMTISSMIASNPPAAWMFYYRGLVHYELNDRRSAIEDLRTAKKMGFIPTDDAVNYLIFPEYLANEVARGYFDYPLTAGNGFKTRFTRKDSLHGGMRTERSCFDVFFYDLRISVKPKDKEISGSNTIFFKVLNDTKKIQIDLFAGLDIEMITWHNRDLGFRRECNAVFIDFPESLTAGIRDSIFIKYSGKPHIAINPPWNGGFVWEKKKGKDWVGVACEHLGASCWWPNKDVIADRPDSMKITVTTPAGFQGLSNGNLRNVIKTADKWSFEWFVSYPITNYLVTLYVGDFIDLHKTYSNSGPQDTIPLDFYVLPSNGNKASEYYSQTETILKTYEKLYGPYPFHRDGVAMVEAPYAGMENQSAIAIGDEYGKRNRRVYDKCDYDYLLVHETAHEWWGNAVGMREMADAWISEGFTTYSEFLFMEQVYGYDRYMNLAVSAMTMILNIWPVVGNTGVNDNTFLGGDIYNKGAIMLHNLRCLLNNDTLFFGMLRTFYGKNIYRTVSTGDFISFATSYTGKDLNPFLGKFLFEKDPPILNYRFARDGDDILFSYRWVEVDAGFEMPFLLFTNDGRQLRLEGSSGYRTTILPDTKSFLIANFSWYPKNRIMKNALTYFQTVLTDWSPDIELYPGGKKHKEGYKSQNTIVGNYREYYPDGTLRRISHFSDGRLNGEASWYSVAGIKTMTKNYHNDTLEGKCFSFYESGKTEAEGNYHNGEQSGIWKFYNPSGGLAAQGQFNGNSGLSGSWKYYNSGGTEIAVDSIRISVNNPPHYFDGDEAMYALIQRHLMAQPVKADGQPSGKVFISFCVSSNGSLSEFKVERSDSEELGQKVLQALKIMPRWAPGYFNNEPAIVKVIFPFRISVD